MRVGSPASPSGIGDERFIAGAIRNFRDREAVGPSRIEFFRCQGHDVDFGVECEHTELQLVGAE